MSLTALTERVHSDGAIPPGRKYFLLMYNHPDTTQRQTENTDRSKWASDLREAKDAGLENFELFTNELQMMNGDTDRGLNSATKAM